MRQPWRRSMTGDDVRDYLIDEGVRLQPDPIEAACCLISAGFSILVVAMGLDQVRAMVPPLIQHMLDELPAVN